MAATLKSESIRAPKKSDETVRTLQVDRRCRLRDFALRYFGDAGMTQVLCRFNPKLSPTTWLVAGQRLRVPSLKQVRALQFARNSEHAPSTGFDEENYEARCLRLVRDIHVPEGAFVDTTIERYLDDTSHHHDLWVNVDEAETAVPETHVKAEAQSLLASKQTRRALRFWAAALANTVSPEGWLLLLQTMEVKPKQLSAILAALGLPATLILVLQRSAAAILSAATELAAEPLAKGLYQSAVHQDQSPIWSSRLPVQVALASGVPLMHSSHLRTWGSAELHRQVALHFKAIREDFLSVERDWSVLPAEIQGRFQVAWQGEVRETETRCRQSRALTVFGHLQARYGQHVNDIRTRPDLQGVPGLLRNVSLKTQRIVYPWQLYCPQDSDTKLLQAVSARLATGVLQAIENGPHHLPALAFPARDVTHPRGMRTMLTTSRPCRPDGARVVDTLKRCFNNPPRRKISAAAVPEGPGQWEHVLSFARGLQRPIPVAGRYLSDYGLAVFLAACANSPWECSWFHPKLDVAVSFGLLERYAAKALIKMEERIIHPESGHKNTKAPERPRGFAYALRA